MVNTISLGTNREFFWDDYLVDTEMTTARFTACEATLHQKDVMILDRLYEQSISYPIVVKDEKGYKMYYIGYRVIDKIQATLSVLESEDGLNWTRPSLGIAEFEGYDHTNILLSDAWDNLTVRLDTNPDCPPEERYKAIGWGEQRNYVKGEITKLWCYTSPDGYHFTRSHIICSLDGFDSMNIWFWDGERYVVYLRGYHHGDSYRETLKRAPYLKTVMPDLKCGTRDVRVMYSKDFRNWTEPKLIEFDDGLDMPLYTNNIMEYPLRWYACGLPNKIQRTQPMDSQL